jgi:hypothetical protein
MPQPASYGHRPLRAWPPETLAALRAQVAALLRFSELLPADLYVKLDLLREDLSAVISPEPVLHVPAFTPRPQPRDHRR